VQFVGANLRDGFGFVRVGRGEGWGILLRGGRGNGEFDWRLITEVFGADGLRAEFLVLLGWKGGWGGRGRGSSGEGEGLIDRFEYDGIGRVNPFLIVDCEFGRREGTGSGGELWWLVAGSFFEEMPVLWLGILYMGLGEVGEKKGGGVWGGRGEKSCLGDKEESCKSNRDWGGKRGERRGARV